MGNPSDHSMTGIDHEPWHRQFWPWFLIILPGIVVVASIITVVIAFRSADTLVADNYYKEGLAINKTVADLNNARAMNLQGELAFTGNRLTLSLTSDRPLDDKEILLGFQHPLDKAQDSYITLQLQGDGRYAAELPALSPGKWYISLQSGKTTRPWRLIATAHLPATGITIRPE